MATDPHTAVKQELLVRYLDFWTPAVVGAGRGATYLDTSGHGPAVALRVFAEFSDLLAGRGLSLLATEPPPDPAPAGLHVGRAPADLTAAVAAAGAGAVLAHLAGPADPAVLHALGRTRAGELLQVTPAQPGDPRQDLSAAGFGFAVAVELVDEAGSAELLRFATSTERHLERFKEDLWAVDQFAGVRYRDPLEPEAVPLDISMEPHPGPLRRALLSYLAAQPRTVQELRAYALAHTLYRPGDVPRALHPLLSRGALVREPERGRLTASTVLRLAGWGGRAGRGTNARRPSAGQPEGPRP